MNFIFISQWRKEKFLNIKYMNKMNTEVMIILNTKEKVLNCYSTKNCNTQKDNYLPQKDVLYNE